MVSDKWKKLAVKEEKVSVCGETITIKGLSFKDIGNLAKYQEDKQRDQALRFIIETTLRKAPEVEGEEDLVWLIENMSAEASTQVLEKVMDISGLNDKKTKNSLSTSE